MPDPVVVPIGGALPCRRCGKTFIRQVQNQRLCWKPCMKRRSGSSNKPLSSSEAGYGAEHVRRRRQALAAWQDGDPCARCGGPMHHGEPVHLDHTDDRTGYLGLSHASCNCSHTGRLHRVSRETVCDHCGLTYRTRWEAQRYCSVACRKAAPRPPRASHQPKIKQPQQRHCANCGQEFDGRRRYCSSKCAYLGLPPIDTTGQPRVVGLSHYERLIRCIRRVDGSDHWPWCGTLTRTGAPQVHYKGRTRSGRQAIWDFVVGPIPAKHRLRRRCDEPLCVNPGHAELVEVKG